MTIDVVYETQDCASAALSSSLNLPVLNFFLFTKLNLPLNDKSWGYKECKKKHNYTVLDEFPVRFWGSTCGVVANILDSHIIISKFKLQSCNDIHFVTNTRVKGMKYLFIL